MKPMLNDFENASQDFLDNSLVATAPTAYSHIIFPTSLFSEETDDPKVVFPGLFDSYAKGAGFEAHQCQLCKKKKKERKKKKKKRNPLLIQKILML